MRIAVNKFSGCSRVGRSGRSDKDATCKCKALGLVHLYIVLKFKFTAFVSRVLAILCPEQKNRYKLIHLCVPDCLSRLKNNMSAHFEKSLKLILV